MIVWGGGGGGALNVIPIKQRRSHTPGGQADEGQNAETEKQQS